MGYISGCSAEVEWGGVAWRRPVRRMKMASTRVVNAYRPGIFWGYILMSYKFTLMVCGGKGSRWVDI